MPHFKKIIIFEDPSHAKEISKHRYSEDEAILSFSVAGKLTLDRKGLKCYYPDELIELPDLNQIGIENMERVKKICNFLDSRLCDKFIFLRENDLNLFSGSYFVIKRYFDVLYTCYFILEKLFERVDAEEIIIFKKTYPLDGFLKGRNPIVPSLIEGIFSKKYNRIRFISDHRPMRGNLYRQQGLKNVLKEVFNLLLNRNAKIPYHSNGILLYDTHDIPYLLKGVLGDINFYRLYMGKLFTILYSICSFDFRLRITGRGGRRCNNLIREIFRQVMEIEEYRNMFIDDKDLFHFTNRCLEEYFLQTAGRLLPYAEKIKGSLASLTPKILLTSACRLNIREAFLLGLAKSLNVPIVTYQEGGGAGYLDWPMFNPDMDLSDYFLVYGNGVKTSPFIRGRAKVIPVGSIRLADIEKKAAVKTSPETKIYIVLDLFKTGMRQRYPYNGGFFSQAYRHQLKILETLKRIRPMKFILKTIKGREFLYEPFIDKDSIQIVTKPLPNVLNDASAFILDFPSTVLQECLLTGRPTALLYNHGCVNFEDNALRQLGKRVRISSDPEQFYEVITSLIRDVKSGTSMTKENEFLKNYCLMQDTHRNLRDFFSKVLEDRYERNNPYISKREAYAAT